MTKVRRIVAGEMHMLTRRCTRGLFLLRPDEETWNLFLYCLAIASNKYGVLVHYACLMANHYHLGVTDPQGRQPEFVAWFNRQMARGIQRLRGWEHEVWEPNRSYNDCVLLNAEAFFKSAGYVLSNPVSAGLVSRGREYRNGLLDGRHVRQGKLLIQRPKVLFGNNYPKEVTLEVKVPPALGMTKTDYLETLEQAVCAAACDARAKHRRFMGWHRVLQTNPFKSPRKPQPKGRMSPSFIAVTKEAIRTAIQTLKDFQQAYRDAFERFRAGDHQVLFPLGTYWMVKYGGAASL